LAGIAYAKMAIAYAKMTKEMKATRERRMIADITGDIEPEKKMNMPENVFPTTLKGETVYRFRRRVGQKRAGSRHKYQCPFEASVVLMLWKAIVHIVDGIPSIFDKLKAGNAEVTVELEDGSYVQKNIHTKVTVCMEDGSRVRKTILSIIEYEVETFVQIQELDLKQLTRPRQRVVANFMFEMDLNTGQKKLISASMECEAIFEMSRKSLLNIRSDSTINPFNTLDRVLFSTAMHKSSCSLTVMDVTHRIRTKSGLKWIHSHAVPKRDGDKIIWRGTWSV